ncbi:glycine betaine ABC transporter substrate-binding protein [Pedobacter lusitanus]|uniref:glycine betaine ABC transporter substrate-binding protein n=1 Tax=Pedobacter lusitanus TaxID=1503925 RepID=UPI0021D04DDD|nr:glycine betaine ABC transporter substrate-binding protein [Pedobacter lusitanus]
MDELNANTSLFEGKIIGIDAGAGIMNKAELAIKDYKLKYELQSASEAAMLAILKKSIDAKKPVVITGWAPHYIFSTYKLKFLNDPKGVFGKVETLQTVANKEFVKLNPQVSSFFRNFQLDDDQLGSLMAALKGADDEKVAIDKWLTAHNEFSVRMGSFLKSDSIK